MTRNRSGNRRGNCWCNRRGNRRGNHSSNRSGNHPGSSLDPVDMALDEIIAGVPSRSAGNTTNPFSSSSANSTDAHSSVHGPEGSPTSDPGSMGVASLTWPHHIIVNGRTSNEHPVLTFFDTSHAFNFVTSWMCLPIGWTDSDFHGQFTRSLPHIYRLASAAEYTRAQSPFSLILTDQGLVQVQSICMPFQKYEARGLPWTHSDRVQFRQFWMTVSASDQDQHVEFWQDAQVPGEWYIPKIRIDFNLPSREIRVGYT